MRRLFLPTLGVYISLAGVLLIQALVTDGRPPFWFYFPLRALTFGSSMILNPNLNAMALIPVAAAVFVSGLITAVLVVRMLALDSEPILQPVAN